MRRRPGQATGNPAARQRKRPAGEARTFRVLLVDRGLQLGTLLAQCGFDGRLQVTQAQTLDEAHRRLDHQRVDLVLIDPDLPDGSGMKLAQELSHGKSGTQTIVVTRKPSLADAIEAIRLGASDFIIKPLDPAELRRRVDEAIQRHDAQRGAHQQIRRLRRVCQKLNRARQEVTQQVDILCNDLVTAYQELAGQMQQVAQTSEFSTILKRELDLEQLLRKVLEFLLEKAGPTNAAIFLPTGSDEFTLGGYINYDCSTGSCDLVLTHLADVLAPKVSKHTGVLHLADNTAITKWIGDDSAYLADSHLLTASARHKDETLAVVALFRDHGQPFGAELVDTFKAICAPLGEYLARIIRVHHRHLPPPGEPGASGDQGELPF